LGIDPKPTPKGRRFILSQSPNTDMDAHNSEQETPVREPFYEESNIPLFLRGGSEGKKGNAQDEKDKTAE